ncbi:hypothetical protein [Flavobacterium sp.]|uniref:hypothetical protein n=1 Tax=Flavobacterium sp. TaxID=239 RepID=UPI00403375DD
MDSSLIEKYEIVFREKLLIFQGGHPSRKVKIAETNNIYLSSFLIDWRDVEMINEALLPGIEAVLRGEIHEFETGSDRFLVLVDPLFTVFYIENTDDYPKVATIDFRNIVAGWRDYLVS